MVLPTVVENKTTLSMTGKVDWCHANKHNPSHVSCLTLVKISDVDKRILRYLINNFDFSLIPDQLPEPAWSVQNNKRIMGGAIPDTMA